jgi:hypothetical protein
VALDGLAQAPVGGANECTVIQLFLVWCVWLRDECVVRVRACQEGLASSGLAAEAKSAGRAAGTRTEKPRRAIAIQKILGGRQNEEERHLKKCFVHVFYLAGPASTSLSINHWQEGEETKKKE